MERSGTVGGAEEKERKRSLQATFAFTDDDFECYVQTIEDSVAPDEQRPWSIKYGTLSAQRTNNWS